MPSRQTVTPRMTTTPRRWPGRLDLARIVDIALVIARSAGLDHDAVRSGYTLLWQFAYGEILTTRYDRPDTHSHAIARATAATAGAVK